MDKHEGNGEARHGLQVVVKETELALVHTGPNSTAPIFDRLDSVEWSAPETVPFIGLWLAVLVENSSMAFYTFIMPSFFRLSPFKSCV